MGTSCGELEITNAFSQRPRRNNFGGPAMEKNGGGDKVTCTEGGSAQETPVVRRGGSGSPPSRIGPQLPPWASPAKLAQGDDTCGSNRKRTRQLVADDCMLEEILGQITQKINTMSTGERARPELVAAFLEVLGCSSEEAGFYLESSMWDIETALMLWLENNPHPVTSFAAYAPPVFVKRFRDIAVNVIGLPVEWQARVDSLNGSIYFLHIPSGARQVSVPAGFADVESAGTSLSVAKDYLTDWADSTGTAEANLARPQTPTTATVLEHVFGTDSEYFRAVDDSLAFNTYQSWTAQQVQEQHSINENEDAALCMIVADAQDVRNFESDLASDASSD